MRTRISIMTIAGFVLLAGAVGGAELTLGAERVVSSQDLDEYRPQVAYNSARDEYLVVWHDVSPIQSRSIMGQRLDSSGVLIDEFIIAFEDLPPRDNAQPTVAYDPFHDLYLVAWIHDAFGNQSDWDIWGRVIAGDGPSASDLPFSICTFTSHQWNPRVDFATLQSEFLVTWWNEGSGGVNSYVSAQRVSPAGATIGSTITVASGTGERVAPDVSYNPARDEYLVVFQKMDTGNGDVYGVRIGPLGSIIGSGEFAIAGWPDPEITPRVASSRVADEWAVAWESQRAGTLKDIFVRQLWVDQAGVVQFAAPLEVSVGTINERAPDIAAHYHGTEYLIAWEQQYSNSTGPFGIWARSLNTAGELGPTADVRGVYAGFPVDSGLPEIAASRWDWFVAWQQTRMDGTYIDIHGRLVRGPIFTDGFESGGIFAWSSSSP